MELAKLKEKNKMDQQKIEHLEDRIKYLEEAIRDLKNDKDFLLDQIKGSPRTPVWQNDQFIAFPFILASVVTMVSV